MTPPPPLSPLTLTCGGTGDHRSQIDIVVEVMQSDGGLKSACLNAITLALIDAGLPMRDFMASCTASCIDGHVLVDTNYIEDR